MFEIVGQKALCKKNTSFPRSKAASPLLNMIRAVEPGQHTYIRSHQIETLLELLIERCLLEY
jgi:hypothetical protein